MTRRRRKAPEHAGNERWLVSYADFITLLFAFFTSMYAISTVDAAKAGKMVFSTRAAFNLDFFPSEKPVLGHPTQTPATVADVVLHANPVDAGMPKRKVAAGAGPPSSVKMRQLAQELDRYVGLNDLRGKIQVNLFRERLIVSLAAAAFFDPGTSELKAEVLPVLDRLASKLATAGEVVRVEGHTDNDPVAPGRFRSNWDLSTSRAVRVVEYLIEEYAFPGDRLVAAGHGPHRPVADNATPEGRARNRRVDLVLEARSAVY